MIRVYGLAFLAMALMMVSPLTAVFGESRVRPAQIWATIATPVLAVLAIALAGQASELAQAGAGGAAVFGLASILAHLAMLATPVIALPPSTYGEGGMTKAGLLHHALPYAGFLLTAYFSISLWMFANLESLQG